MRFNPNHHAFQPNSKRVSTQMKINVNQKKTRVIQRKHVSFQHIKQSDNLVLLNQ